MWVLIVVAALVVVAAGYAFWPRRGGISDSRVLSSRRSTHGGIESSNPSNQRNWPTGG